MFFVLSKIFWEVMRPTVLLQIILIVGLLLVWSRRGRKAGVTVLVGCVVVMVGLQYSTLTAVLQETLEDRFPQITEQQLPDDIEGIIVLGGAVAGGRIAQARGAPMLSNGAERMTEALVLARRYPHAKILFTGFSNRINPSAYTEADGARLFFERQGIAPDRLILENRAQSTAQNAVNTVALVGDRPPSKWVLITSSWHMPRSMGCFAAQGWVPIAFPVDYSTLPDIPLTFSTTADGLVFLPGVMHEYIGLLAYRLSGRIPTLFPSPKSVKAYGRSVHSATPAGTSGMAPTASGPAASVSVPETTGTGQGSQPAK